MDKLLPKELSRLLPLYGSARAHAHRIGVSHVTVSRAMNGDIVPSSETLQELVDCMSQEHRDAIGIAFLIDHRLANTPGIKVGVNAEGFDRLDHAVAALSPSARNHLARYVEAINRAPEVGYRALEGLAGMVSDTPPTPTPSAAFATTAAATAGLLNETTGEASSAPQSGPAKKYPKFRKPKKDDQAGEAG